MQKEANPEYYAIFAVSQPIARTKILVVCNHVMKDVLHYVCPSEYHYRHGPSSSQKKYYALETKPTKAEIDTIAVDKTSKEHGECPFNVPPGVYHCTCLYVGSDSCLVPTLDAQQKEIYATWKSGIDQLLQIEFIVYIPGFIMAGYIPKHGDIKVDNQFPHMTLLLKCGATAVQSNTVLAQLHKYCPEIFVARKKRVTCLEVPYEAANSRIMIVIDQRIRVEGRTDSDIQRMPPK